ncbi:MAG: hypothetical protein K6G15_09010 [Desulfovibrio sp.]|nr:hypothetical protein [Desulfovibrio sp.]
MSEQMAAKRTGPGALFFVTILLLLILAIVGFEFYQKWQNEIRLSRDAQAQAQLRQGKLEERMRYLQHLLTLSPCEAQAKWQMP